MEQMKPHIFCNYCGSSFLGQENWPKTCTSCRQITYRNPLPVVVVVVPLIDPKNTFRSETTTTGVLAVRRNIPPDMGGLALISGYIDDQEHWRDAAVRELKEETTLHFRQEQLDLMGVDSSKNKKHILVFCKTPRMFLDQVPDMEPNEEVQELVVVNDPSQLVWEAHQKMAGRVWAK